MPTSSVIQQFFRQVDHSEVKMSSFKQGQIFFGKITKLFPNQMAEVQVGNQKLIAQLETPLSADERYWFQVQQADGKIHLKVLTTASKDLNNLANSPEQIISKLSLPQSREMTALVKFLMKEQIPISREMLTVASQWLKETNNIATGLQVIQQVIGQQLPFTNDVLSAIASMRNSTPISNLISNLQTQLSKEVQTSETRALLGQLMNLNSNIEGKVTEQTLNNIVKKWLFGNDSEQKSAFRLLQTLGLFSQNSSEITIVNKLLKTLPTQIHNLSLNSSNEQIIRQQMQLLNQLQASIENNDSSIIEKILKNSSQSSSEGREQTLMNDASRATQLLVRTVLQSLYSEISRSTPSQSQAGQVSSEINEKILSILSNDSRQHVEISSRLNNLINEEVVKSSSQTSLNNQVQLSNSERLILQAAMSEIEEQIPKWDNKEFFLRNISQIIKSLGLNYESEIQANKLDEVNERLKPLLMNYINETQPNSSRATAEQLLHRLTGMQLFSKEVGPQQQVLMQIPVQMWNKTIDLTMQWSGQKTSDGKIDPNYCRVLFYLQLDNIDETVVDLQVQNKIMNITVFNDNINIKQIGSLFFKELKENIEAGYYKLSAVTYKQFKKDKQVEEKRRFTIQTDHRYTGVDFRV